jgi:hypothetical protein
MMLAGDGLAGAYFNDGPDSAHLVNLAGTRVDATVNFPNDVLGSNGGGMVADDDNYSIRWTGWVLVDQPGAWQFKTLSNDGVRLWVDDVQLIDNWDQHTVQTDTATRNITAGWHPIRLEYFQEDGTAHIELRYSGPGRSEVIIPQSHLSSTSPNGLTPTVDAGPNRVVLLPQNTVMLNGSATDDGTIESVQWTQLQGPNAATLSDANTEKLTASGLTSGTYVFQLKATDDDGNMGTDTATVVVAHQTGAGTLTGELKTWHKVTVTFDGPQSSETATPNPFLDYRLDVTFAHAVGGQTYVVPGYFAADGDSANSGATSGDKWRVHFAPPHEGEWTYSVSFRAGANVAVNDNPLAGVGAGFMDGAAGSFVIAPTDKSGDDLRGKGQLQYVGAHYLRFAETGEYFLKQGADSPENLLAYTEFDGPFGTDGQNDQFVKNWSAHVQDWNVGDPTWGQGKGKGLIGAINYLASEGQNAVSFLTMNIAGDDRNVFPYLDYNERLRLDVSRLEQWEVIFEHADHLGMYLHFKTQETENDQLLDGGALGTQRKLYYRELVARFAHHLALNWNLGEENTNTTAQRIAFAQYFHSLDPYDHNIVVHTFPGQQNSVYTPLLGNASELTGLSLQLSGSSDAHDLVRTWVTNSAAAGKKWVVAIDESGGANQGIRPDNDAGTSHEEGRKNTLWGTLLAGGAGDEWYFGYDHAHSDLTLTDFRSRDRWWDYTRYALDFFEDNEIPFWEMGNNNAISSAANDYAFVKPGEWYVVYLKSGGTTNLDLSAQTGVFDVSWFDPRNGGALQPGSVAALNGGNVVSLGAAPSAPTLDWVVLVRRPDLPGDYDHDGAVDDDDYLVWRADFGSTTKLDADGNNDSVVNAADYVLWRRNSGNTIPVAESASLPASLDLLLADSAAGESVAVDVSRQKLAEYASDAAVKKFVSRSIGLPVRSHFTVRHKDNLLLIGYPVLTADSQLRAHQSTSPDAQLADAEVESIRISYAARDNALETLDIFAVPGAGAGYW